MQLAEGEERAEDFLRWLWREAFGRGRTQRAAARAGEAGPGKLLPSLENRNWKLEKGQEKDAF